MNVAVYLRKSRADNQSESICDTLARHKDTLLHFARENGLSIYSCYEEVVSGDSLFVRPEMLRLLRDAEENLFDGILCMDIDRLGRGNMKESGIIIETLKEHNVKIITPRKVYDLTDDIDEFSTEMQTLIARQELKNTTRRLRLGLKKSAEEGCHLTEAPYGYRRCYLDKRPTLKIVSEEAEVLRLIFSMYIQEQMGASRIAQTLDSLGFVNRDGLPFSRSSIRFFLQNELYTGKIIWNRYHHAKKKCVGDKIHITQNPETEWIVAEGLHPAIIDMETFRCAQDIRLSRAHPPANGRTLKNPFAGLIFCQNCSRPMRRQSGSVPRLLCETPGCCHSALFSEIEKSVSKAVTDVLMSMPFEPPKKRIPSCSSSILKRQISTLQVQRDSLYGLLERGIYDKDTFSRRKTWLETRLSSLSALLCSPCPPPPDIRRLSFSDTSFLELPANKQNMIYKRMIARIEYQYIHAPQLVIFFQDWV